MNKNGTVVVIEDDEDDQEILRLIFKKLDYSNPVVFFHDGYEALEYLNRDDVQPFLILSDINMPKINGFELRAKVQADAQLHAKCIPYLFLTTSANDQAVLDAYAISVQGFFVKPSGFDKMEATIYKIMEYWKECKSPRLS
jgi:CheY-like chemotaxis protein